MPPRDIPELDTIETDIADLQSRLTTAEGEIRELKLAAGKPPVIAPPIVIPPPVEPPKPTPPIVVTDPVVPVPPPDALHTRDFSGDDVGAKYNAAEAALGDRPGSIVVDDAGTIATQMILNRLASSSRKVYFGNGVFPIVNPAPTSKDPQGARYWQGAILQNHRTSVFGVPGTQIIEPAEFGWIVFQAFQDTIAVQNTPGGEITEDLSIDLIQILGANDTPDGGVRSTVQYGNVHRATATRVWLKGTSALGITAGGHAQTGKHCEDFHAFKNRFEGVASQNLSAVNAIRFLFEDNEFINAGKFANMGVTPLDLEPNDEKDLIQGTVRNNRIDSTGSPFIHGNGILAQNTVGTSNYSALIEGNVIKGGFKVATGIYLGGQYRMKDTNEPIRDSNGNDIGIQFARDNPSLVRVNVIENVIVRNNDVQEVVNSLYRVELGRNVRFEGNNRGISDGVGGTEKTEVQIFDTEGSTFSGFRLKLSKINDPHAKQQLRMYQTGISKNNSYSDNDGLEMTVIPDTFPPSRR